MGDNFRAYLLYGVAVLGILWVILTIAINKLEPAEKKLYKVTFPSGSVIIDSLRDEENSLENERIKYPKASVKSYEEIKSKK